MTIKKRTKDIAPFDSPPSFDIKIDDKTVPVFEGETVLSALIATSHKGIMENDKCVVSGAYCGMGVCHCCHVKINDKHKQRACQTVVKPDMQVQTRRNRFHEEGIKNGLS